MEWKSKKRTRWEGKISQVTGVLFPLGLPPAWLDGAHSRANKTTFFSTRLKWPAGFGQTVKLVFIKKGNIEMMWIFREIIRNPINQTAVTLVGWVGYIPPNRNSIRAQAQGAGDPQRACGLSSQAGIRQFDTICLFLKIKAVFWEN